MRVNEIFWSIQGEGSRIGCPAVFIRLTGCTLQCPYCDSKPAWDQGAVMSVAGLRNKVTDLKSACPDSQVVITGGEPLEQDLRELVAGLKDDGHFVALETNGIYFQDLAADWWTVSPKDIGGYYVSPDLKGKISEVKLIANRNLDPAVVETIRGIRKDFPIFLQPDHSERDRLRRTFALFQACQRQGIADVRLGIQLHRIYRIP